MKDDVVLSIIEKHLRLSMEPSERPSGRDWINLERYFDISFPVNFKRFIDCMSFFVFPGEVFNVVSNSVNRNDSIKDVYIFEIKLGTWPKDLVPFYGVGNGDYLCLSRLESEFSKVYYYNHEDQSYTAEYDSFDDWLLDLSDYV